jgi:hypothetical protein
MTAGRLGRGPRAKAVEAARRVDGVRDVIVHEHAAGPVDFGTVSSLTYLRFVRLLIVPSFVC